MGGAQALRNRRGPGRGRNLPHPGAGDRARPRAAAACARAERPAGPDRPRHARVGPDAGGGAGRRDRRRRAATRCSAASCRPPPPRSSTRRYGFDLAAVVSASHNPYRDNGIKFFSAAGTQARRRDRGADRGDRLATASTGRRAAGPRPRAERRPRGLPARAPVGLPRSTSPGCESMLDCANGATYRAAPAIFERLGAEVEAMAAEPDGRNINDGCGSTHVEQPRRAGRRQRTPRSASPSTATATACWRSTGPGGSHDGDELIALAAAHLAARGELGGGVAVTVMTNYGFHQAMEEAGIEVATTQVGDRYVLEELRRRGWKLGGEQSGHIIAMDFAPTGDGIAAALLTLQALGGAPAGRRRGRSRSCRRRWSTSRSPTARRSPDATAVWEAVERENARPRGPRPGPRPPLGHRAAGPGDGRGAERRRRRGGLRARRAGRRSWLERDRLRPSERTPAGSPTGDALPLSASCAASSDTSAAAPAATCSSPAWRSSSTAAMTRPGSRSSPTATSTASARSATSPTCAPRSRSTSTAAASRSRRPPATTGVAHTRWATHGRVTEENAHPHNDCTDRIHIVLNGIVENHAELRRRLEAEGHAFSSETDAEIVAHLIERHYDGDLAAAVRAVVRRAARPLRLRRDARRRAASGSSAPARSAR